MHDKQADSPNFSIVNEGPLAKPLAELYQGTMAHKTDKHATNRIKELLPEENVSDYVPIVKAAAIIGCSPQTITRNAERLGVELVKSGFAEKRQRIYLKPSDVERLKTMWIKR